MDSAEPQEPGPPEIAWIEGIPKGRLMIGPMPGGFRDLERDIEKLKKRGVDVVVSLLSYDEAVAVGLIREPEVCAGYGIQFLFFPVRDHSVPKSRRTTAPFVFQLKLLLDNNKSILIHCRAGIGRSATIAACVMGMLGIPPEPAFEKIGVARGYPLVPEMEEQREWTHSFYDFITSGQG